MPQIEVKFDIDANGIINVTATDTATKKDAKITIESSSKLSPDEIERLRQDAEKFSEEDAKKKEAVQTKNEAESYVYTTEKLLADTLKDKVSQEQGIKITDAMREVREAIDKDSADLRAKLEALQKLVNEVTVEIYKNAAPGPQAEGGQAGEQAGEQAGADGQQGGPQAEEPPGAEPGQGGKTN